MFGKVLLDVVEVSTATVKVAAMPLAMTAAVVKEVVKPLGDAASDATKAVSRDVASIFK